MTADMVERTQLWTDVLRVRCGVGDTPRPHDNETGYGPPRPGPRARGRTAGAAAGVAGRVGRARTTGADRFFECAARRRRFGLTATELR